MAEELEPIEGEEAVDEAEATEPTPEELAERQEVEAQARKYGWRPREEYTLDPNGWVDADRFMESAKTQRKVLRDQVKDYEAKLKERDDRLSRIEATNRQAIETLQRQERERYEGRIATIEAQKRAAAEAGDLERYDQLSQAASQVRPPQPAPAAPPPTMPDWVNDHELRQVGAALIDSTPGIAAMPPERQIAWAEGRLKALYPDKFPQDAAPPAAPTTQRTSRVDGGGLAASPRRGKGVDDLPPEARQAGKEWVEAGVFKSLDDYAKAYHEQGV